MRKYYYSVGKDRKGPFTLDELKSVDGFIPESLVWYAGLPSWTRADTLPELSEVFVTAVPPPLPEVPPALPHAVGSSGRVDRELFAHPFSFKGRIRRLEYGLSTVISSCVGVLNILILGGYDALIAGFISFAISAISYWFVIAQGAKRCHDIGKSGWWQLIPFYGLWLLFQNGNRRTNEYGTNPKLNSGISKTQKKVCIALAIIIEMIALTVMIVKLSGQTSDISQFFGLTEAEKEEFIKLFREESKESSLSGSVTDTYSGGDGTQENPYLISSRSDMEALAINVTRGHTYKDTCFLLTRDLTGTKDIVTTVIETFSGVFDGGGHSIAVNIDVHGDGEQAGGVFSGTYNATIKNLNVSGKISVSSTGRRIHDTGYTYSSAYAGGIVGYYAGYEYAIIINCYNSAEIIVEAKDEAYAGGIAGFFKDAYEYRGDEDGIRNCHNSGKISAIGGNWTYAGGIAGQFFGGQINDCRNSGKVSIDGGCAGGIVGSCGYEHNYSGGKMIKCINSGEIYAKGPGQIVGYDDKELISTAYVGGIAGDDSDHLATYGHNSNNGEIRDLSSGRKK
jgi:uncharacterized membrane protein YhaH (DUF805 family)